MDFLNYLSLGRLSIYQGIWEEYYLKDIVIDMEIGGNQILQWLKVLLPWELKFRIFQVL